MHGTPTWSYLWRNVVPALTSRFSVYVFDLLGYGDSPAPPGADVSLASHARGFVELLDYWRVETPAVAGHDIGGAIVLRAHLLEGRQFRRIALVDAVALAPWITPTTCHIQAHLDAYRTMPTDVFAQITATHLRTAVHSGMDEATLSAYERPWSGEAGQAACLEKVAYFNEDETRELEPLLGTIRIPVQIVWGDQDAWLDPALGSQLRDVIPGAELTVIPRAGHFAMEDAPAAVGAGASPFSSR